MQKVFILLFIFISYFPVNGYSKNSLSIETGQSGDNTDIYIIGIKHNSGISLSNTNIGSLSLHYETSLHQWRNDIQENIYAVSISPIFQYQFNTPSRKLKPYIELSVGLGYISDKDFKDHDMATHFQFEDKISIGAKFKSFNIFAKYTHWSNANIKWPNDGIDIMALGISYKF